MSTDKIKDRIRKLLELSRSENEHEAANAAAAAAKMMAEHEVSEAMLEVMDATHKPEPIITGLPTEVSGETEKLKRRIAWKEMISGGVATSVGCHTHFGGHGGRSLCALGRESAVASWRYLCQYLFLTVDRLAEEAWNEDARDLVNAGQRPSVWKNAFRMGCASVIAARLRATAQERKAAQKALADTEAKLLPSSETVWAANEALTRSTQALAIVARGAAEVEEVFKKKTTGPGWRKVPSIGSVSSRSGYESGREAGATVPLTAGGKSLKSGSGS